MQLKMTRYCVSPLHQSMARAPGGLCPRRGMTLMELLAAMMVLLVGVYSIAALFPKLSKNVSEEEKRTAVARLVSRGAERLHSGADQAPDATAPDNASVNLVDPDSRPADPDSSDLVENPPNSRDDFVIVYGEDVTVPAPPIPGGYSCYVPKGGLLDLGTVPEITELASMQPMLYDPGPSGAVPPGHYYLRPNGQLRSDPGTGWVQVAYDWHDPADGLLKRVSGEVVAQDQFVHAVTARGGAVVSDSAKAHALYTYTGLIGTLASSPPGDGEFLVDSLGGQVIYFAPSAAGRQLKISYAMRRESGRRALIMYEEISIPTTEPYQARLSFGMLDDETPLATTDYLGNNINSIYLMAVDLSDGTTFAFGQGSVATDPISYVDFTTGTVWFNPAAPALTGRAGNPIRVYYRTMDDHSIQVQKAPSEFIEVASGIAPAVPNWEHRAYMVGVGAAFTGSAQHTCLYSFPAYTEDEAVQVEYLVNVGGAPVRVTNELHVIADLAGIGFGFVLNEPNVAGVLSVRGASMRVSGWWRSETGRVNRVDVTNMLFQGT